MRSMGERRPKLNADWSRLSAVLHGANKKEMGVRAAWPSKTEYGLRIRKLGLGLADSQRLHTSLSNFFYSLLQHCLELPRVAFGLSHRLKITPFLVVQFQFDGFGLSSLSFTHNSWSAECLPLAPSLCFP